MPPLSRFVTIVSIAILPCMVGCRPTMQKITGKVSVDGEPLTSGSVAFYPTAGGTSRSVPLSSDGTFLLSSTDPQGGLATGEYKVVIATDAVEGNPQPAVPNEYRDVATTPLKQLVRRTNSPQYFVYEIRTKMR